jgi:holo-[acyl-carrier protein] synthase
MTPAVGIDLVSVQEVADALTRHGDAYLARVYTEREIRESRVGDVVQPARLARCFAAKEATLKALGERGASCALSDVELAGDDVHLSGAAASHAEAAGLARWQVSTSAVSGYAAAFVLAG